MVEHDGSSLGTSITGTERVPSSGTLAMEELGYIINYSEANTLFVGPELVELASQLRARLPKVRNFVSF